MPKLAIVGLGSQGRKHFEAALALQSRGAVRLVATCDPALKTTGFCTHYQQFSQMLESEKLDVVVIAVPNVFHQNMCQQLLEKGTSIVKEKPVALNLDQVAQLQRLARKHNASVITCQQRFFKPEWIALQKLVADSQDITSFHFAFSVDDYVKSWYWNLDQAGGGVWLNMGWHPLQMINWLFGLVESVVVTTNSGGKRPWEYQTDHSALAKVTLKKGITGTVFVSCVHPQKNLVRIETKNGVISLAGEKLTQITNGKSQATLYQESSDPYQLQLETYLQMIAKHTSTLDQDAEILKNILFAVEKQRKIEDDTLGN